MDAQIGAGLYVTGTREQGMRGLTGGRPPSGYVEGNPTACFSATTAGLPHVEDQRALTAASLVFLSTFTLLAAAGNLTRRMWLRAFRNQPIAEFHLFFSFVVRAAARCDEPGLHGPRR
jgi:hypothetical protein